MKVSIIIPERNEEEFIAQCLDSVLANDFPKNHYEILVVDGMSVDGTLGIVKSYAMKHNNIKLLENPGKIASSALNMGIKNARGRYILRIDGHCTIEKDYIKQCVNLLDKNKEYSCVGGPICSVNRSFAGKAIAAAMSSNFGVGGAKFRCSKKEGFVDTLAFGAYRKEVFDKIGLFDENLVRNQDDEFNFRLVKNGGKIFMTPEIKSYYYPRSSLGKLWKQYFQYGFWKAAVIRKHKAVASLRHIIPATFVLSLLIFGILALFSFYGKILFFLILGSYMLADLLASFAVSLKKGLAYFSVLPLIYPILHFSYGLGFLAGIIYFGLVKKI